MTHSLRFNSLARSILQAFMLLVCSLCCAAAATAAGGKSRAGYESPPGAVESATPALRVMQEYSANWVLGCRGTF